MLFAMLCGTGVAQAECAAPYTPVEMGSDLTQATASLRSLDEVAFTEAGTRLEAGLGCLQTQVPKAAYATVYRYLGALAFLGGDEATARGWFRTALELDAIFEWDITELPVGHPLRALFEAERAVAEAPTVAAVGQVLAPPTGTVLFLDGRPLREPRATADRPHLVQVVVEGGRSVQAVYRMEGADFPAALLVTPLVGEAVAVADTPDVGKAMGIQVLQRVRPAMKTPMLMGGGAVMATGLGIYAASFAARARFDAATQSVDLDQARATTNFLVTASGVTMGLGLGLSGVGLLLDGGTGFAFSGSF
jgi:hypothetical protein